MKRVAVVVLAALLSACQRRPADAQPVPSWPAATRSALLDVDFTTRPEFLTAPEPLEKKTHLKAPDGLLVTVGPDTMMIGKIDRQGDESSGWSAGTTCARGHEVFIWRGSTKEPLRDAFLNAVRRTGWTVTQDLSYEFRRGTQVVQAVVAEFDRGQTRTVVAGLCRQPAR